MPLDPCGRVVLWLVSLCRPFGRTLLSGALWRAGPRWCRSVRSLRGVGGVLYVWCGDGCVGGGGGWAGGRGGRSSLRCANARSPLWREIGAGGW